MVLGHKWRTIFVGIHSVAKVCIRCRENGWQL